MSDKAKYITTALGSSNNTAGPDPTKGLTPAGALRQFNTAPDVAKLDRLAIEAEAELTALDQQAARAEAELLGSSKLAKLLGREGVDGSATRRANLKAALDEALAASRTTLMDITLTGPLAEHTRKMWRRVLMLGTTNTVLFSWQPPDPMLPRQTVSADRVPHLEIWSPAALWCGTPALDALAWRAEIVATAGRTEPPPWPLFETFWLDQNELPRGRIFPARPASKSTDEPKERHPRTALTPEMRGVVKDRLDSNASAGYRTILQAMENDHGMYPEVDALQEYLGREKRRRAQKNRRRRQRG